MSQLVTVPDIGGAEDVEVIEICVKEGDTVTAEQALIVLESDKASMEIPAPAAGVVRQLKIKLGDKVSQGAPICALESASTTSDHNAQDKMPVKTNDQTPNVQTSEVKPKAHAVQTNETISLPDIGGSENVEVIEIYVKVGDSIQAEQPLLVLESDKATMEIPAPKAGVIESLLVAVGDEVSAGHPIIVLQTTGGKSAASTSQPPATAAASVTTKSATVVKAPAAPSGNMLNAANNKATQTGDVHAGPAVRKLARELGVDLVAVAGNGPKGRILKEDLHAYVKTKVRQSGAAEGGQALSIPSMPNIDFSKFGPIERVALNKLRKVSAHNLHRSWITVPHVTQFDQVDITEMEAFRKDEVPKLAPEGVKVTPLAFMLKACAKALSQFPKFNASLENDGEHVIIKQYIHIGVAVETPDGLVVPVIKNVDQKSLFELAIECAGTAKKARDKKLSLDAMQGGTFSISSLGGIGGTAFTPIVKAPEVAILGISKSEIKPLWNGKTFEPRLILPLCLSYDHRVIDGADAARFTTYLSGLLSDIRRLVL